MQETTTRTTIRINRKAIEFVGLHVCVWRVDDFYMYEYTQKYECAKRMTKEENKYKRYKMYLYRTKGNHLNSTVLCAVSVQLYKI